MTHQDILTAINAAATDAGKRRAKVREDLELVLAPLRLKCGELGHITQLQGIGQNRYCVVCGTVERHEA